MLRRYNGRGHPWQSYMHAAYMGPDRASAAEPDLSGEAAEPPQLQGFGPVGLGRFELPTS